MKEIFVQNVLDTTFVFSYLIASMGLQVLWSFVLACLDAFALRIKSDLRSPVLVSLFVVGDWVTYQNPYFSITIFFV